MKSSRRALPVRSRRVGAGSQPLRLPPEPPCHIRNPGKQGAACRVEPEHSKGHRTLCIEDGNADRCWAGDRGAACTHRIGHPYPPFDGVLCCRSTPPIDKFEETIGAESFHNSKD